MDGCLEGWMDVLMDDGFSLLDAMQLSITLSSGLKSVLYKKYIYIDLSFFSMSDFHMCFETGSQVLKTSWTTVNE